jgi:hypothetical protein
MHLNQQIQVSGCITQEKYIKGKNAAELERILGFKTGRLYAGFAVVVLEQLPNNDQFDLLGYSQVAGHKFGVDALKGLDVEKLKNMLRQETFALAGINRLVKILPNIPHQTYIGNDENKQYPPGLGVPQWKLTKEIAAKVIAVVPQNGRFV